MTTPAPGSPLLGSSPYAAAWHYVLADGRYKTDFQRLSTAAYALLASKVLPLPVGHVSPLEMRTRYQLDAVYVKQASELADALFGKCVATAGKEDLIARAENLCLRWAAYAADRECALTAPCATDTWTERVCYGAKRLHAASGAAPPDTA